MLTSRIARIPANSDYSHQLDAQARDESDVARIVMIGKIGEVHRRSPSLASRASSRTWRSLRRFRFVVDVMHQPRQRIDEILQKPPLEFFFRLVLRRHGQVGRKPRLKGPRVDDLCRFLVRFVVVRDDLRDRQRAAR